MPNAFTAKDLNTLRAMGTPAAGWVMPPIDWEIREVPVEVREYCSSYVLEHQDGKQVRVTCPTCRGTGRRSRVVMRKMEVGIVRWPAGTKFRSPRLGDCGLCGKAIKHSNLLPLVNQAEDGATVGMWVGCDCAGKFAGVPVFKCYDNADGVSLVREAQLPQRPAKPAELEALEVEAKRAYNDEQAMYYHLTYLDLDVERGTMTADQAAEYRAEYARRKAALKAARAAVKAVKDPHKAAIAAWEAECNRIRAQYV